MAGAQRAGQGQAPLGLLMVSAGRSPLDTMWYPVSVWLPLPLMSRLAELLPVNPDCTSTLAAAARVPVAPAWLRVPLNRFR